MAKVFKSAKKMTDAITKDFSDYLTGVKKQVVTQLGTAAYDTRKLIIETVEGQKTRTPHPDKEGDPKKSFANNWAVDIFAESPAINFFSAGIGNIAELEANVPYYRLIDNGFLPPESHGFFGQGDAPSTGEGGQYWTVGEGYSLKPKNPFPGFHYSIQAHIYLDKRISTGLKKVKL